LIHNLLEDGHARSHPTSSPELLPSTEDAGLQNDANLSLIAFRAKRATLTSDKTR